MKAKLFTTAMGAALLMAGGNAYAADLGGNCCADLEERIAELEATTARKGNRKVSLTVTGWVSSQIFWFDDGEESNVYVDDNNDDLSSNFKFTGSAQISPGWKAGYSLLIGTAGPSSLVDSSDGQPNSYGLNVNNSYWWVQSDQLGKLSVGKQSLASDNSTIFTDFTPTLFPSNTVATFDGFNMHVVVNGVQTGTRWHQAAYWCEHAGLGIANDCNGLRQNGVRYDTPTFGGFSASASWGEDDFWDVVARYAGENGGFKMAFAVAYSETTDNASAGGVATNDSNFFQVGGTIQHLASGLWVHSTWSQESIDDGPAHAPHQDATGFFVKAGWTGKLNSLGNTSFWGEYGDNNDAFANTAGCGGCVFGVQIAESDATRLGLGMTQEIDAAAMNFWVKYTQRDLDLTDANGAAFEADTLRMFLAGAVIFY